MTYAKRVAADEKVKLKKYDPSDHAGLTEAEVAAKTLALGKELSDLQDLHYAAGKHSLLIVLQGLDTSGKDGSIKHLYTHINAQSCRVENFKVPTEEELVHDFLWRVHKVTPRLGQTVIFNRSHYEDVLVTRVHKLVSNVEIKNRYARINGFETLLTDANTIIVKFFLHISKEEQERRLVEREQDRSKAWKLSAGDWKERSYWEPYQEAYEHLLEKCSTECAPWFLIPANHKWFRDLAILEALVKTLSPYKKVWEKALAQEAKERLAEVEAVKKG